jgi:DNA repair exonuclease SbcCD ATPase subunit
MSELHTSMEICPGCGTEFATEEHAKANKVIATQQAHITELLESLEKESFYARKQKALRVEANSKLAELSKHAHAMATSVGCTSKAFRDYWDYVEQRGGE